MYSDSGKKVMNLATILATLVVIVSVIEGIVVWVTMGRVRQGGLGFVIFLVVVALGAAIAYVSYLMMYAFGELVDNSSQILRVLSEKSNASAESNTSPSGRMYPNAVPEQKKEGSVASGMTVCPFCKKQLPKGTVFCGGCGAQIGSLN